MNILTKLTVFMSGKPDPNKRSVISRRFIIAVAIIYSSLILAVSLSFFIVMNINGAIMRDALDTNAKDILVERTELIVSRLRMEGVRSPEDVTRALTSYNQGAGRLMAATVFTKTSDENYFRIAETLSFHDDFKTGLARSAVVREEKKTNYLKQGLVRIVVDPTFYSQDGYSWHNAYAPYELGRKKAVVQIMMSASSFLDSVEQYARDTRGIRIFLIVLTSLLVLAVIILSAVFLQNYSLLIGNLSRFMNKAAEGDLDISLHESDDDELNRLAQSFNTLIEEMKDLSARPQSEAAPAPTRHEAPALPETPAAPPSEPEESGTLFTTGVALLKDGRLDDAIAIFRSLTIVKPQGFGSWFNLGVAHAKKRDYGLAVRMFEEARSLNPGFEVTAQYIDRIRRLMAPDA